MPPKDIVVFMIQPPVFEMIYNSLPLTLSLKMLAISLAAMRLCTTLFETALHLQPSQVPALIRRVTCGT
jgi:hypothetical protein